MSAMRSQLWLSSSRPPSTDCSASMDCGGTLSRSVTDSIPRLEKARSSTDLPLRIAYRLPGGRRVTHYNAARRLEQMRRTYLNNRLFLADDGDDELEVDLGMQRHGNKRLFR